MGHLVRILLIAVLLAVTVSVSLLGAASAKMEIAMTSTSVDDIEMKGCEACGPAAKTSSAICYLVCAASHFAPLAALEISKPAGLSSVKPVLLSRSLNSIEQTHESPPPKNDILI